MAKTYWVLPNCHWGDRKNVKTNNSVLLACIGQLGKKVYGSFIFDNSNNQFKKRCPRNRKTLHEIKETETESTSAEIFPWYDRLSKKKPLKFG